MITERHDFTPDLPGQFIRDITDKTLFFDIETTGFSPKTSHLYMIGYSYMDASGFHTIQWFDDHKTPDGEKEMLLSFAEFAKNYTRCISFNGSTFDFPFIQKKCAGHHLSDPLCHLEHIDIYKKLKPYKDFLDLPDLKQKSVEAFLGINRQDQYSGGQLIAVYDAYIRTKSESLYNQLMQHNYDDICGMILLMPVMAYIRLFEGAFTFHSYSIAGSCLTLTFTLTNFILIPVTCEHSILKIHASAYTLTMTICGITGMLKYFYANPKDYYYLPAEDMAVHKSVAAFVDKDFRQKATKENCYIKKDGFFLPQPKPLFTPEYRTKAAQTPSYFAWDTIKNQPDSICRYARLLLNSEF